MCSTIVMSPVGDFLRRILGALTVRREFTRWDCSVKGLSGLELPGLGPLEVVMIGRQPTFFPGGDCFLKAVVGGWDQPAEPCPVAWAVPAGSSAGEQRTALEFHQ